MIESKMYNIGQQGKFLRPREDEVRKSWQWDCLYIVPTFGLAQKTRPSESAFFAQETPEEEKKRTLGCGFK